jgi:hypothetical protein
MEGSLISGKDPGQMNLDVLITTSPGDIHAAAVSVALERHGRSVMRWYPAAYPLSNEISFQLPRSTGSRLTLALGCGRVLSFPDDRVRTFWYRRKGRPILSRHLHPSDRELAVLTCQRAIDATIWYVGGCAGLAVNDFAAALRAEYSKMLQLQVAAECGFRCPATLISNSPEEITAFLAANPGESIFKSLLFVTWESEQGQATNFTAPVTIDDLPSEEILRSCPGIFQEKITKSHEVRVTIMGKHVVAARLDSQSLDDSRNDWRVLGPRVPVQQIQLPADVQARCLAVMRRLDLVFGCMDLIVTPEGEHVFLEVNQEGQFLWLEERAPSIRLLDTFAQFLGSGDREFTGPTRPATVAFESIRAEADALVEQDMQEQSPPLEEQSNIISEHARGDAPAPLLPPA